MELEKPKYKQKKRKSQQKSTIQELKNKNENPEVESFGEGCKKEASISSDALNEPNERIETDTHTLCVRNEIINSSKSKDICEKTVVQKDQSRFSCVNSVFKDDKVSSIYPILSEVSSTIEQREENSVLIQPFTKIQLNQFYLNDEISFIELFENEFVENEAKSTKIHEHKLYVLLKKFACSRAQMIENLNKLKAIDEKLDESIEKNWKIEKRTVTKHEFCGCGKAIKGNGISTRAIFCDAAHYDLQQNMKEIRNMTFINHNQHVHEYLLYEWQIEQIFNELLNSRHFSHISNDSPISFDKEIAVYSFDMENDMNNLRIYLSVLFKFYRERLYDEKVLLRVQEWITNLVALQIRVASWKDHAFILFHILRCPSGVGSWAANFIQIPSFNGSFDSIRFQHCIAILSTLIMPIKSRTMFLQTGSKNLSLNNSKNDKDLWVIVDSDGEEDDDSSKTEVFGLKENDIVSFFEQIPLKDIFLAVTTFDKNDETFNFDVQKLSSGNYIIKIIAFAMNFVEIIERGILEYSTLRYKQFAKRLGKLIQHMLLYVADIMDIHFKNRVYMDPEQCERIHTEFDQLIFSSAKVIYETKGIGLFQYLSDFPFKLVSSKSLKKLYCLLHIGDFKQLNDTCYLNVDAFSLTFDNNLAQDDLFFLLQVFYKMAISRKNTDIEFIRFVTIDLLNLGFINEATRETCYNTVKDLLTDITNNHPALINDIFDSVKTQLHIVGDLNIYLFKSIALVKWKPIESDLETLASWLLNFDIDTIESITARLIFSHLNWDYDSNNQLFFSRDVHLDMVKLISKAYMKFIDGFNDIDINETYNLITKRNIRNQSSKERFSNWCWTIASVLKLHLLENKQQLHYFDLRSFPEIEYMNTIYQSFQENISFGIYLSILTSQIGHSIPQICQFGFEKLKYLTKDHRYARVIRCLELMIPLFVDCLESLYSCDHFFNLLKDIFSADNVNFKNMKEHLDPQFNRPVLTLFSYMIQNQITSYHEYGFSSPKIIISLWTNSFIRINDWSKNIEIVTILEQICQVAYFYVDAWETLREIFTLLINSDVTKVSKQSGFLNFIAMEEKNVLLSPLEEAPMLSLLILECDFENIEIKSGLWNELTAELSMEKNISLVNALKKVLLNSQLPNFAPKLLVIYKFAKLLNICPNDHFMFPIICQQFFHLYLYCANNDANIQDKFYNHDITLMKKIKRKLEETEHFHKNSTVNQQCSEKSHFHMRCALLFKSYTIWLEETQLSYLLQKNTILPPHFNQEKLKLIFEGKVKFNEDHWTEYINISEMRNDQKNNSKKWLKVSMRTNVQNSMDPINLKNDVSEESPQRILNRLENYKKPLKAPEFKTKPVLGKIDTSKNTLQLLRIKYNILKNSAEHFNLEFKQIQALHADFTDLIRSLYRNEQITQITSVNCPGLFDNCQNSTVIKIETFEMRRNESIKDKLDSNRELQKQLISKKLEMINSKIVDSVFCLEHIIHQLIFIYEDSKAKNDMDQCRKVLEICSSFFYEILRTKMIDNEDPIFKFFCSNNVHTLGNVIIKQNCNTEIENLLKIAVENTNMTNLISELIIPATVTPINFINSYEYLVNAYFGNHDSQKLFVLFSKFEIPLWLEQQKPRVVEVSRLINVIVQGLELCTNDDSDLVQNLLQCHLCQLFMYQFPEFYGEIIKKILIGFSQRRLKSTVLLEILNTLYQTFGCTKIEIRKPLSKMKDEMRSFSSKQNLLDYSNIYSTTLMISEHFYNERLQYGLHGVYPKFSDYCEVLSVLLGTIGHLLIYKAVQTFSESTGDQLINSIWSSLSNMFAPWLVPFCSQNTGDTPSKWIQQFASVDSTLQLQPWSKPHMEKAEQIICVFSMCLQYILDTLPANNLLIGHLFCWYVDYFANIATPPYVLQPIHAMLMKMQYERFWPTIDHLKDGFNKILLNFVPECHTFLGYIFLRIPWTQWLLTQIKIWNNQVTQEILGIFLMITVKLSHEPKVQESIKILQILQESTKYPWTSLHIKDVESVLNWFVMSTDSSLILNASVKHETLDYNLLILLQTVCCMNSDNIPKNSENFQTFTSITAKRMIYVRSFMRLLISCDAKLHKLLSTTQGRNSFYQSFNSLMNLILSCFEDYDISLESEEVINLIITIIQTMNHSVPESTLCLISEATTLWQKSCNSGNIVLYNFPNALKFNQNWSLSTFQILESSICAFLRTYDASSSSKWLVYYQRLGNLSNNIQSINYQLLLDNDLSLSLYILSVMKLSSILDDTLKIEYLHKLKAKLLSKKIMEDTEMGIILMWAFIIISLVNLLMKSNASKNDLITINVHFRDNIAQPDGWSEGFFGFFKKQDQSNKSKLLLRSFSCAILALFVSEEKYSNEYDSAIDDLKAASNNKKYLDLKLQTIQAIDLIENEKSDFPNCFNKTIGNLVSIFYCESYLDSFENLLCS